MSYAFTIHLRVIDFQHKMMHISCNIATETDLKKEVITPMYRKTSELLRSSPAIILFYVNSYLDVDRLSNIVTRSLSRFL